MDTIEKPISRKKPHVGNNISQLRRMRGMNQHDLATEMKVKQQTLSIIENSEEVDDETLERVAKALGIPAEVIRNYDHETTINNIANNNTISGENSNNAVFTEEQVTTINNPLDKVTELYERLLSEQKEKYEELKKQLNDITSELIELKNRK